MKEICKKVLFHIRYQWSDTNFFIMYHQIAPKTTTNRESKKSLCFCIRKKSSELKKSKNLFKNEFDNQMFFMLLKT